MATTPQQIAQALQTAATALRGGNPKAAIATLRGLPDGADTLYLRGLAHSALGQWAEGDAAFAKARRLSPRPGEVLANHGNMWRRAGQLGRALELYREAQQLPGAPGNIRHLIGLALHGLGRDHEAKPVLEAHCAAHAQDAAAWNALGTTLSALDELEAAARAFDRSIALKPQSVPARLNRISVARRMGDEEAEAQHLGEGLRIAPGQPDLLREKARAATARHDYDAARSHYREALKADPARVDLYAEAARFQWETGDQDSFLDVFALAPEQLPQGIHAALHAQAGALAMRADRLVLAREHFERSLAAQPGNPTALAGRAQVAEDHEKEALWRKALEQQPENGTIRLGLAWHLLNHNEAQEAEAILAKTHAPGEEMLVYAYDSTAARMLGRERYGQYYDLDRVTAVRTIEPPERYGSLESFLGAVEESLDRLFTHKVAPIDQTLFGGQQTPGSLWNTGDPVLRDLRGAMLAEASRFWNELDVAPGHPLHRPEKKRGLRFGGAWSVRLTSGGGHRDHVHPAGLFSSAHYVTVPAEIRASENGQAGCLRLGRPNLDTIDLPPERVIRPEPGMLILFPSYMWHGVEAFSSESPRITTPADFLPC